MRYAKLFLMGVVLLGALALGLTAARAQDAKKADARVFELRTYTAEEGKLGALHARFRDHTNKLFIKHGMTVIGYWTPTDEKLGKNTLVYLLAFPSLEAQKQAWAAFRDDPAWKSAKEASEKDGKLVTKVESQLLTPTDYSPLK